jgi:hypothetical protein
MSSSAVYLKVLSSVYVQLRLNYLQRRGERFMTDNRNKLIALISFALTVTLTIMLLPPASTNASDHADSPLNSMDQGVDQGDTYAFLDPNDNSKLIIAETVRGFIVPGEANNEAFFDPGVRHVFEIENTGDAKPDLFFYVTFSKVTAQTSPQTATITLPNGRQFTAPTTPPTLAPTPNPQAITTDATSGVAFFAGEVDDPFFFDIPAFSRFRASALRGAADPSVFNRGRDTFAGYDIQAIVMSVPVAMLKGTGNVIGVDTLTQRRVPQLFTKAGDLLGFGRFVTLDRGATPGINALIIPFARKNEYNASTTVDDANGKFAGDIIATLRALGTDDTSIGILAGVAVNRGDFLHLDVTVPNSGAGGGNNAAAAFPNGRRPADDVVDTILTLINNRQRLGDNVNGNDVPFQDRFPFLALPQQPRDSGVDDSTRN